MNSINQKSTILVTGGTGFLGANIIKQLIIQGYKVKAIKRGNSKMPFFVEQEILNKVEWVEGDVLEIDSLRVAMQGIDKVIHAAAVVSYRERDRRKMYAVNIDGTANVVNIALEEGVTRLVYISSVAAIGSEKEEKPANEKSRWVQDKNMPHYSITKFNAEKEVWRGFAEGLEGVVINPATIIGFGDWNDGSCAIFKNVFDEFGWYTNGINGFVGVDDVAKAVVLAMESTITEERYIVSANNWGFKKLFDAIAIGFNKKKPTKLVTPLVASIAWRIEKLKSWITGSKALITKESARIAGNVTFYDNAKFLKDFPSFQYQSLEETINEACVKYVAHKNQ